MYVLQITYLNGFSENLSFGAIRLHLVDMKCDHLF